MENVNEQINDAVKSPSKIIIAVVSVAAVIGLMVVYFALKQTSPVKVPEQKKQVSNLKPTLIPLVINEKPQTEMLMDVKNQLISAFK